jgi:outer membrane receptor for monomeric catechols
LSIITGSEADGPDRKTFSRLWELAEPLLNRLRGGSEAARINAFKPERGQLLKIRFKFDTAQHRIQGTASVYQINQTNVITADHNNPSFSMQLGEQRSRGVEFSAATHLTHQWDLITGYALTNATIYKYNTYLVDSFLQSVPATP